ncbi:MAG: S1C family serine protease, partial [Ruminococcus sp.]
YDTRTDLAVLKISAKNLTPVSFGKSNDFMVGDDIIAVGNPGGVNFQNSLTKGIVSAKDRSIDDSSVTYIQTDAAVNPGNSGGPLCNLYGQVVGITTAKISSSVYEGMGFAIPTETIKEITDDIIQKGYVENRVRIGITGFTLNSYTASMYEVPQGIVITEISKDGSLANTNAKEGDIITEFDGTKITNFSQIYSILEKHKSGDKVKVILYRVDSKDSSKGQSITVTATLTADKGETQK